MAVAEGELTVQSKITPEIFREFAYFDIFSHQKRWRGPVVFAFILTLAAAIVLSRADSTRGAGLLGGVLLTVGLGLPLVYFVNFFISVGKRARMFTGTVVAYTVALGEEGVLVTKNGQNALYPWDKVFRVYRLEESVALYVDPAHAFLLTGRLDSIWRRVAARLPQEKCREHFNRKSRQ